jgi:hypothetical protein
MAVGYRYPNNLGPPGLSCSRYSSLALAVSSPPTESSPKARDYVRGGHQMCRFCHFDNVHFSVHLALIVEHAKKPQSFVGSGFAMVDARGLEPLASTVSIWFGSQSTLVNCTQQTSILRGFAAFSGNPPLSTESLHESTE